MKKNIKQKTIGINPLEEYLSYGQESSISEDEQIQDNVNQKQRITFHISVDLINRIKNAVYWEPGLTLAHFAEIALEKAIDEFERERGGPFPERREHKLKGGRPIK